MKRTILYGPRDVRFEERPDPENHRADGCHHALAATCVCGSDLWPYRGVDTSSEPTPMGHEYCGIVEEVGSAVNNVKPGQFVVGSFFASDNTCPICQAGYQSRCVDARLMGKEGAQAPVSARPARRRNPRRYAGTSDDDLIPGLLATSDVLGTGWFAADAANVQPGNTVAIVGDGAVGLCGVIAAKQMGAERIS